MVGGCGGGAGGFGRWGGKVEVVAEGIVDAGGGGGAEGGGGGVGCCCGGGDAERLGKGVSLECSCLVVVRWTYHDVWLVGALEAAGLMGLFWR